MCVYIYIYIHIHIYIYIYIYVYIYVCTYVGGAEGRASGYEKHNFAMTTPATTTSMLSGEPIRCGRDLGCRNLHTPNLCLAHWGRASNLYLKKYCIVKSWVHTYRSLRPLPASRTPPHSALFSREERAGLAVRSWSTTYVIYNIYTHTHVYMYIYIYMYTYS